MAARRFVEVLRRAERAAEESIEAAREHLREGGSAADVLASGGTRSPGAGSCESCRAWDLPFSPRDRLLGSRGRPQALSTGPSSRSRRFEARRPASCIAARAACSARPGESSCRTPRSAQMAAKMSCTSLGAMPSEGSSRSSIDGPRHDRATDGEHLLLAAGERAPLLAHALAEPRKELHDVVERFADALRVPVVVGAEIEVFAHGEVRKDGAPFRHEADAEIDDRFGFELVQAVAGEARWCRTRAAGAA